MPPKKPSYSFDSIRILSKKAQDLLHKARSAKDQPFAPTEEVELKSSPKEELVMHLSVQSVLKGAFTILAIAAGTWLLFHLRTKIILLFLAVFIAVVIDPSVEVLQRWGVPRGIAVLMHYFIASFLVIFLLVSLIPIVALQLQQIAVILSNQVDAFLTDPTISLPLMTDDMNRQLTVLAQTSLQDLNIHRFTDALQQFGRNLSGAAQGSVRFVTDLAGSVVNFLVSLVLVLVLAFFIQLEKERIIRWVRSFLPWKYRKYLDLKSEAIHTKIGQWARGEALLMLSIFTVTWVALFILRMDYALTLAVLAGFCEIIPAIGPFIAAVPAVLIALTQDGIVKAIVIAGIYYVIQWTENNLLVPLIMKRAVGLSPIAIIFAMMVGVSFPQTIHPVVGVILAIPLTTIITIFLEDWRTMRSSARERP